MPSPIAHAALAIPAHALLAAPARGPVRGPMVWALLAFACVAPDMDIPIEWVRTGDAFINHGSYSHSLLLAPAFGLLFLGAMKRISPGVRTGRAFAIGTALYALHVTMDLLTAGSRGVSLLWPLVPDRLGSPIGLFVGVEHSDWARIDRHLMTVATEGVFALGVWAITRLVRKRADRERADG